MPYFHVFGVFRGFLLFGDKIEDVIAQQICLLVTEDDFVKSGGIGEGDGRGVSGWRRAALPDSMSDALLPSQTALQDFTFNQDSFCSRTSCKDEH